jgi:uncharacterized protein YbaR (Trm112 family)
MLEASKLSSENIKAFGGRYVDAPRLLEALFTPECRPSLRWLRQQQAARKIPSVKIGRLIFFDPAACKAALDAKSGKGRAA